MGHREYFYERTKQDALSHRRDMQTTNKKYRSGGVFLTLSVIALSCLIFYFLLWNSNINGTITATHIDVLEFATYWGNGIVCFILGLLLLSVKTDFHLNGNKAYRQVKILMAYSMLLNSVSDMAIISMQASGNSITTLNRFFIPLMFFMQMYIMSFSTLKLIHSGRSSRTSLKGIKWASAITVSLYCISFGIHSKGMLSIENYTLFIGTPIETAITIAFYIIIAAALICCATWILKDIKEYSRKIDDYFAGQQEINGQKLTYMAYCFLGYFILSGIDLVVRSSSGDLFLTWINLFILIGATIIVFNLQTVYQNMQPAIDYYDTDQQQVQETKTQDKEASPAETEKNTVSNKTQRIMMEDLIDLWVKRKDSPYLKENVTLTKTAKEIGISPRILSEFLNTVYDINFNTWINQLRIDRIKDEMKNNENITLTELAEMTGFTDSSAMSKVFKRLEGITPSVYRNQLHDNGPIYKP